MLAHQAAAVVDMGTCWPWETTATLSSQHPGEEERGGDISWRLPAYILLCIRNREWLILILFFLTFHLSDVYRKALVHIRYWNCNIGLMWLKMCEVECASIKEEPVSYVFCVNIFMVINYRYVSLTLILLIYLIVCATLMALFFCCCGLFNMVWPQNNSNMKKALRETQTLHARWL